jgi:hypothetical protein
MISGTNTLHRLFFFRGEYLQWIDSPRCSASQHSLVFHSCTSATFPCLQQSQATTAIARDSTMQFESHQEACLIMTSCWHTHDIERCVLDRLETHSSQKIWRIFRPKIWRFMEYFHEPNLFLEREYPFAYGLRIFVYFPEPAGFCVALGILRQFARLALWRFRS